MATEIPVPPLSQQDLRDLGFGSVVSRESRQRLLNRDGSFNVERKGLPFWSFNPYHALLTMGWSKFFLICGGWYIAANCAFALGYLACGPDALGSETVGMEHHSFLRAFFFSVQTLSTIGYGHVVPIGLASNILVTIESLVGLLGFAIITGLIFARFSRPTAKVLFSQHAVIAPYQGIQAFEFRVANGRTNELIEIAATVMMTRFENVAGVSTRQYYRLPLERPGVTFLPLTWTVVHPIDEASPLRGETGESMRASNTEFLVLLSGFDETFSATVHTRTSYVPDEIICGSRFASAFMREAESQFADGKNVGGKVAVNMQLFDKIEKVG